MDPILSQPDHNQDIGRGDGVYISTYGCQMNVNDSERMYALLEMANFVPVATPEQARLIIINSCSVREKPVHKVHSEVGRYRRLKDRDASVRIGVAGCVAQQEKDKLMRDIPLLDFVVGTDAIDQLPEMMARLRGGEKRLTAARFEHQKPYHIETMVRNPGVSTFINITKGCDNFCTFCVVPFTRGRERSRPLSMIVKDVRELVGRGVKEVTLLGQNVNSYLSECGTNFAHLLRVLAEDTDIQRIRYTTSHPKDFNQELVDIMQKYRTKICDYIHLPAQSGNSEVLQRMNRVYSREEYLEKVRMICETIPGVALSTDLIVGFPGETEAQFADTMTLLDEVFYDNIYAFKYSPRPFTKAAKFTDQVDEEVKSERLQRLIDHHREQAFARVGILNGQTLEILVEEHDQSRGMLTGRSTTNKVVHFLGAPELIGQTCAVRVLQAFPSTIRGELVN
jgi:tRNA-2-methylthio-N6-dimethylallyladenosine synthase